MTEESKSGLRAAGQKPEYKKPSRKKMYSRENHVGLKCKSNYNLQLLQGKSKRKPEYKAEQD